MIPGAPGLSGILGLHEKSHIRIKLLLPILHAEAFALQGADPLQAAARLLLMHVALADEFDEPRTLDLLLEALLDAVVALFGPADGVNRHKLRYLKEGSAGAQAEKSPTPIATRATTGARRCIRAWIAPPLRLPLRRLSPHPRRPWRR